MLCTLNYLTKSFLKNKCVKLFSYTLPRLRECMFVIHSVRFMMH